MTIRALKEEIETRLLGNPQAAVDLAKDIREPGVVSYTEVLLAIAFLKRQGALIEIDGKLYVQRTPESS